MAGRTIYTRAYSSDSAGGLTAAKATKGDPLSETNLLEEFLNHADPWNREPTALISCSDRIVDTMKRAFHKHFQDGEASADVRVAFIEVPSREQPNAVRIHSAKELAGMCGMPDPRVLTHEFVFEYSIPEEYVLHEVSLQTLLDRGLQADDFYQTSTLEVRTCVAQKLQIDNP